MKRQFLFASMLLALGLASCTVNDNAADEIEKQNAPKDGDDVIALIEKAETQASGDEVVVTLPAGITFTQSAPIATAKKLTIQSDATNPATIQTTGFTVANTLTITNVNIDASELESPLFALAEEPVVENINNFYRLDAITIDGAKITGVKNSLVFDNKTQYCVVALTIKNSVIQLATEAVQNEAIISFQQGGVKDFTIENSTVSGNGDVAKYFIRYNNNSRLDRYGFDKETEFQTMTYLNNTFYNLLKDDGQWGNYNGIQGMVYSKFDIKNNIWCDCGKDIIRRLAGGRFNGNNPMEFLHNTYWNDGADLSESEASYDKSETILTSDPAFKDAANGDFTPTGADQVANKTGDPRWL